MNPSRLIPMQMKRSFVSLSLILLAVVADNLYAQVNLRIDPNIKKPAASIMSAEKEAEVLQTTKNILNNYTQRISLRDPNSKIVTSEMINSFSELFAPTATLPDDYKAEVREVMQIRDYCNEIFLKMKLDGIQVVFNDFLLKEIKDDPDGFYKVYVDVTKTRYNYLNAAGKVEKSTSGKRMKQTMSIDIRKGSAHLGQIRSLVQVIEGKADRPFERDISVVGLSLGAGSGSITTTETPLFKTASSGSDFKTKSGLNVSIGFDFTTTKVVNARKSSNKNAQLLLGVRYAIEQVTANLSNFSVAPFQATATTSSASQSYSRKAGPINGTEKLTIGLLEPYLGLGYRVSNKRQSKLYVSLKAIPTFTISNSGNLEGLGRYDGTISRFRFLGNNSFRPDLLQNPLGAGPYQVGNRVLDSGLESNLKGALAFQLSPALYLDLTDDNPTWGISIGLDLTYHPTYLSSDDSYEEHALLFPDDRLQGSLHEYYSDKISAFTYGLRIGLYRKRVK